MANIDSELNNILINLQVAKNRALLEDSEERQLITKNIKLK